MSTIIDTASIRRPTPQPVPSTEKHQNTAHIMSRRGRGAMRGTVRRAHAASSAATATAIQRKTTHRGSRRAKAATAKQV